MQITEKQLEDIIFNTNNETLRRRGLEIFGKKMRQVGIGNYGKLDLVTYHRHEWFTDPNGPLVINIIELKKYEIGINALSQIMKYAQGIMEYLFKRNFCNFVIELTLIGSKIDATNNMFAYLPNLISPKKSNLLSLVSINYYTYKFVCNGIYFDFHKGCSLKNKGF